MATLTPKIHKALRAKTNGIVHDWSVVRQISLGIYPIGRNAILKINKSSQYVLKVISQLENFQFEPNY